MHSSRHKGNIVKCVIRHGILTYNPLSSFYRLWLQLLIKSSLQTQNMQRSHLQLSTQSINGRSAYILHIPL